MGGLPVIVLKDIKIRIFQIVSLTYLARLYTISKKDNDNTGTFTIVVFNKKLEYFLTTISTVYGHLLSQEYHVRVAEPIKTRYHPF